MKPTNRVLIALAVLTALSGLAGAQPLDVATLLVEARAMAENEDFEAWGEHASDGWCTCNAETERWE